MSRPYQATPHMPEHAVSVYRAAPAAPPGTPPDERMVRFYPAWRESKQAVESVMRERPRGFRVSV